MHIDISGLRIDLTEALHNHVNAEFKKLEKVLDPNARIAIEIGKTTDHHKQGDIFKAEARIIQPKSEHFAEILSEDLYTAINSLSAELFGQITQSKDRHRTLLKRGSSIIKKLLRL